MIPIQNFFVFLRDQITEEEVEKKYTKQHFFFTDNDQQQC